MTSPGSPTSTQQSLTAPKPGCFSGYWLESVTSRSGGQAATGTDTQLVRTPRPWASPFRCSSSQNTQHARAVSAGTGAPDRRRLRGSKGHALNEKTIDLCRDTHTEKPEQTPDSLSGKRARHSQSRAQPAAGFQEQCANLNENLFDIIGKILKPQIQSKWCVQIVGRPLHWPRGQEPRQLIPFLSLNVMSIVYVLFLVWTLLYANLKWELQIRLRSTKPKFLCGLGK